MTRLNWHAFTMPEVPPFGWEDPFYDPEDPIILAYSDRAAEMAREMLGKSIILPNGSRKPRQRSE